MVMSDQHQSGDALKPHGVPPGYEHPHPLGSDVLDPGGPRILPVTQETTHGSEQNREAAEFDRAVREGIADLAAQHAALGFFDRRFEGRRHRAAAIYEHQQPYDIKGWQTRREHP